MQELITADEFITAINEANTAVDLSNKIIEEEINITTGINSKGVVLRNCIFKRKVNFDAVDIKRGIRFIDCKFEESLSFMNCVGQEVLSSFRRFCHLEFSNTEISELLIYPINNLKRGIGIFDESKIDILGIEKLVSSQGGIAIHNSTIKSNIRIMNCQLHGSFEIRDNCTINSRVSIHGTNASSIKFTDSTFYQYVDLWNCDTASLTFNNGTFKDDIYIHAVRINGITTIIGTEYKKSFKFNLYYSEEEKGEIIRELEGIIKELYISNAKFYDELIIEGKIKGRFDYREIEKLTIKASSQLTGAMYFNDFNITLLSLSGDLHNANITFKKCDYNKFTVSNFNNYSNLAFSSGNSYGKNSLFAISNSNLGKTSLYDINLSTFHSVEIYNSVLIDLMIVYVTWFEDEKLNNNNLDPNVHYQKREIYRQLKTAYERQGNRIESLKYKALEMSAFRKESFSSVPMLKGIFNNNRFILWIGQTNNYGQSWSKPVLILLGLALLLYFPIVTGVSNKLTYYPSIRLDDIVTTFQEYWVYLGTYPQLLNPTHILKRVYPKSIKIADAVYWWDYLLKIVLAFFIYQIISAFRKYMK